MKVRSDFVTNSSSSSFIFEKQHTKEDVYKIIHDYLVGYSDRVKAAIEYAANKPEYLDLIRSPYGSIQLEPFPEDRNTRYAIWKDIENRFDICSYYYELPESLDIIIKSSTYQEYRDAVEHEKDSYLVDFELLDYSEVLQTRDDGYGDYNLYDELYGWYVDEDDWNDMEGAKDERLDALFKNKISSSIVLYAGDPGIGYYPEGLLNKLRSMSIECCAHMG